MAFVLVFLPVVGWISDHSVCWRMDFQKSISIYGKGVAKMKRKKVCSKCVFSELPADTHRHFHWCTVHEDRVRAHQSCQYWAQEPEFNPNPEYDYYRDAPQGDELLLQT